MGMKSEGGRPVQMCCDARAEEGEVMNKAMMTDEGIMGCGCEGQQARVKGNQ